MRRYIPRAFGFDMPCRQSDRSLIRSEAAEEEAPDMCARS